MDNIKVSTKTIIAISNLQLDIGKIYSSFPIGRSENNITLQTIYYGTDKRGIITNDKKKRKKSFRNAVNIIAYMDTHKKINFKVSKNGKFQLTGCKSEDHAIDLISFFIQQLFKYCKGTISIDRGTVVRVFFQTVMTNVDFNVGFFINRQKLDELMNKNTSHHSLLETSCGYTGVNIKFLLDTKWWEHEVPSIVCRNIDDENMVWERSRHPLNELMPIPQEKKTKKKYNTFLAFHSGNIIMSGMFKETMEKHYDEFVNLLRQWKSQIEEKIIEN